MAKTLYALKQEAKANRERLDQLLTDLQVSLPMMDDDRIARLLEGFQGVVRGLRDEE